MLCKTCLTFIFSYRFIILQGLSGAAGGFLGIVQLAIYYVKLFILGSTPRSIYDIKFGPRTVQWGTLFPVTTLLTVISKMPPVPCWVSTNFKHSSRLLHYLPNHQWTCCAHFLPLLPPLQVSLFVPIHPTPNFGHGWTFLPESDPARVRGSVCAAGRCFCLAWPASSELNDKQICLCALFFLAVDASGKHSATPEGALMVVLIIFTVISSSLMHA